MNIEKPTLYYVYDPMCSWCWGYRATWSILEKKLLEIVNIEYCLGGLAPDSNEPMPQPMQTFLQQIWNKISQQLGTEFNFNFWEDCQPRRSTYPACRAILVARQQGLEKEMLYAIQQAYYLQAQNPSNNNVLITLAENIGLHKKDFQALLLSEGLNERLMNEIEKARAMPINGFPSLVLKFNAQYFSVKIDYKNWQVSYEQILSVMS